MKLEIRELTPRGSGAIAVIRLRGSRALEALRSITPVAPGVAPRVVPIAFDGEAQDEAVLCATAPEEYELHLHGSPPLVARVLDRLRALADAPGAQSATLEERATELLARAPCEAAARILLDQAEGALRRELLALRDLPDAHRRAGAGVLLERARIAQRALVPADVVLAGPVNAGKSTLFNVLLGERRAIVSAAAGTTRDVVREPALLGAYPVLLADTAGERAPQGGVEAAGQDRARAARAAADLVVWLEPASAEARVSTSTPRESGQRFVVLRTFADRLPARLRASHPDAISATEDSEAARAHVAELFRRAFDLPLDPWTPGAGVPFTGDLVRALEALRSPASDARAALDAVADAAAMP